MRLIEKYLFGKPIENTDAVLLTAITGLNRESPAVLKLKADLANVTRWLQGLDLHYIYTDNPLYFNDNGKLRIRGSELLKHPLLYTSMGWVNPKDLLVDPNKYYSYNDGLFDLNHYTNYTNSDTYSPITNDYLNYIIGNIYSLNKVIGNQKLTERNGSISLKSNMNINPVLTGFVPGSDSMYYDANNPEGFVLAQTGLTSVLSTALGFTGPGNAFYTPYIIKSGYDRLANAEHWYDYALGAGETALGFAPWIIKGYSKLKSAFSPSHNLNQALLKELNTGLNWREYYDYIPKFHKAGVTDTQNALKLGRGISHIHGSELKDFVLKYPKQVEQLVETSTPMPGYVSALVAKNKSTPGFRTNVTFDYPEGEVLPAGVVPTVSDFPKVHFRREGTYDSELEPFYGYNRERTSSFVTRDNGGLAMSKLLFPRNRYVIASDVDDMTSKVVAVVKWDKDGNLVLDSMYPGSSSPTLRNLTSAGRDFSKGFAVDNNLENYLHSKQLSKLGYAIVEENAEEASKTINPYLASKYNKRVTTIPYTPKTINLPISAEAEWSRGLRAVKDYFRSDYVNRRLNDVVKINPIKVLEAANKVFKLTKLDNLGRRAENVGNIGISTFDDVNGPNIFALLLEKFPELRDMNESLFVASLSRDERIAYENAKNKQVLVSITDRMKTDELIGLEEALHRPQYTGGDPYLEILNKYNLGLASKVKARSIEFADPLEIIVRGREMVRQRSLVPTNELKAYYRQKFGGHMTNEQIEMLFYKDMLSNNAGLRSRFPQLSNVRENRLLNQLSNQYILDLNLFDFLKGVVQNTEQIPSENNYSIT